MKTKDTLIILGIIAVLIFVSFFIFKKQTGKTVIPREVIATTTQATISIQTLEEESSSTSAIVQYPQFSNTPALNAKIEAEAKEEYATNTAEMKRNLEEFKSEGMDMSQRTLVFEKKINSEKTYINTEAGIASITYDEYFDFGGAHGTFFFVSKVYDLKTGESLKLQELLTGDYATKIRSLVSSKIAGAKEDSTTCVRCSFLGGKADDEADLLSQNFALTKDGIIFLYGAYELGAYAMTSGGQEVFISKDELKGFVTRAW